MRFDDFAELHYGRKSQSFSDIFSLSTLIAGTAEEISQALRRASPGRL